MIAVVINKDKKTVSPPNPLLVPKPTRDVQSYKNKEEFELDKVRFAKEQEEYLAAQAILPLYPIKGTVCKSGIFVSAEILSYHAEDKREAELHEDNSVTLHGPYK